jgi:hypothetical protein
MYRDFLTVNGTASASKSNNALRSIIIATIGSTALLSAMYVTGGTPAAAQTAAEQEQSETTPINEHQVSVGYLA